MATILKIFGWFVAGLLVLIVGGLAAMYLADPVLTKRAVSIPFGGGLGPEEPVPGGPPIELRVAQAESRSVRQDALDAAVAYGAQTGSHALIVYHDDAIQLEHYYPGFDADYRSATQSMHKSVLAMLVGIAIDEGHIASVDEPAARYLTEWSTDERTSITIRQILQQTSGIGYPTVGFNPLGGFFQLVLGEDITPIALDQPLEAPAGAQFDYNSINPQNLGLLIERATGKRYAAYLSAALWQNLGAPDAAVALDHDGGMARTFCCLYATARSWLHLGVLHLTEGQIDGRRVVPAEWMRAIVSPGPHNPNYGYLTWLGNTYTEYRYYNRKTSVRVHHSEAYLATDVIYFDGFGGQRVYAVPSLGLVIVRTGAMTNDWDDAYLVNTIIRGMVPELAN